MTTDEDDEDRDPMEELILLIMYSLNVPLQEDEIAARANAEIRKAGSIEGAIDAVSRRIRQ